MAAGQLWRHGAACVIVHFRLTPKSSKDSVHGVGHTAEGPASQAHVRALPEHGGADAALVALVPSWLGIPMRSVELAKVSKSPLKSLRIDGVVEAIDRQLQASIVRFEDQT